MEERYEPIKELGSGNFGVARLVRDKKTKELVAVKYIERGNKVKSCRLFVVYLCLLFRLFWIDGNFLELSIGSHKAFSRNVWFNFYIDFFQICQLKIPFLCYHLWKVKIVWPINQILLWCIGRLVKLKRECYVKNFYADMTIFPESYCWISLQTTNCLF